MSSYINCPKCNFPDPSLDVDTLTCDECGFALLKRIKELEAELNSRPTQEAYEAACKALWKHRDENKRLKKKYSDLLRYGVAQKFPNESRQEKQE